MRMDRLLKLCRDKCKMKLTFFEICAHGHAKSNGTGIRSVALTKNWIWKKQYFRKRGYSELP